MAESVIAIDGPAGSGKSTVARALASVLGWSFLDTGAMYRALTVEALARDLDPGDVAALADLAAEVHIEVLPRVSVDGRDVTDEIRTERVNVAVSAVAANPEVRRTMVERQRAFAADQPVGTVVEGRDITTVVFPEATVKVFLTASLEERAQRRGDETPESVARRDAADSNRPASPLRVAEGAITIDTTGRSVDDIVEEIRTWLTKRTN